MVLIRYAVLALLLVLSGCSTNPTTGRSQFNLLSRDEEISIGAQAAPGMVSEYGGAVADPRLREYVTNIGRSMAAVTEADNPTLPWEFTLLNSDVINAFALPGGKVFFSRGLAERLNSEAEMAAVLGHEIGHVTARHVNDRMVQQVGLGLLTVAAGVAATQVDDEYGRAVVPALSVGGSLVVLSFSRDQESESDALGMRYMSRVGYDPRGALGVQQVLAKAMEGGRQPEIFSTHPYPETRIRRIERLLQTEYANTRGELHVERYRSQFLSRLAMIPRSEDSLLLAAAGAVDPHQPVLWCAHCRDAAMEPAPSVARSSN